MNLNQVADRLPRGKNIVHSVVPLTTAIANVGGVETSGKTAPLQDPVTGLVHQPIEVHTTWVAVAVYIIEQDLRLLDIFLIPAGTHLQGIELGPELSMRSAFLLYAGHNQVLQEDGGNLRYQQNQGKNDDLHAHKRQKTSENIRQGNVRRCYRFKVESSRSKRW